MKIVFKIGQSVWCFKFNLIAIGIVIYLFIILVDPNTKLTLGAIGGATLLVAGVIYEWDRFGKKRRGY